MSFVCLVFLVLVFDFWEQLCTDHGLLSVSPVCLHFHVRVSYSLCLSGLLTLNSQSTDSTYACTKHCLTQSSHKHGSLLSGIPHVFQGRGVHL